MLALNDTISSTTPVNDARLVGDKPDTSLVIELITALGSATDDPPDISDSNEFNADVRLASLLEPAAPWISERIELTIDDVAELLAAP